MAGLTACGGGGGEGGDAAGKGGAGSAEAATAALKKASESTGGQKSAKVEGAQTQAMPQGKMVTETKGAIDWSGGGTKAEMEITQKGGASKGTPGAGKPMPVRYTEDAMFLNQGDAAGGMGGAGSKGKPWMKVDYAKLAEQAGPSGALVKDQAQNNNPTRSVDMLLAGGDVEKVGTEKVDGEQADRYSGTVKVSDMARMQSKDLSKKEQDALAKQMEKQGLKTQTIDLWINGDDLLVKKQEKAKSKAGKMESTVSYSDYGTKVNVEEPPASQTMDFEDAMGGAAKPKS